ncbi:MAG: hypothetical protein EOO10_22385 [Chitinophagaceae bacterium]|nr:MAG: hypothetical protein EOO10_22385 [Chitinophagaceae bacterium]
MKNFKVVLTALALFVSSVAMAIPEESVAPNVVSAFRTAYVGAKSVKWDKVGAFYFVTFVIDNREVNVSYNEAGEIVGSSEMITFNEVPVVTQISLREQFGGYTLSPQVYRVSGNGETVYYVTAVNEKRSLKLKCDSEGAISILQRTKLAKQ